MNLSAGIIVITLLSLLASYFLFGRAPQDSARQKFFYWLKSTIFMAVFLFIWIVHKEPAALGLSGLLMSVGLASIANFGRSYLVAMFP